MQTKLYLIIYKQIKNLAIVSKLLKKYHPFILTCVGYKQKKKLQPKTKECHYSMSLYEIMWPGSTVTDISLHLFLSSDMTTVSQSRRQPILAIVSDSGAFHYHVIVPEGRACLIQLLTHIFIIIKTNMCVCKPSVDGQSSRVLNSRS